MDADFYNNGILITWREEAGYSQEEVARELNVTRATINRIENGRNASVEMLYALADLYRKPVTGLFRNNKFASTG